MVISAYLVNALFTLLGFIIAAVIVFLRTPKGTPINLEEIEDVFEEKVEPALTRARRKRKSVAQERERTEAINKFIADDDEESSAL
jgi:hypothetical protein